MGALNSFKMASRSLRISESLSVIKLLRWFSPKDSGRSSWRSELGDVLGAIGIDGVSALADEAEEVAI